MSRLFTTFVNDPIAVKQRLSNELEHLKTRLRLHPLWENDPQLVTMTLITELQDDLMRAETVKQR